MAHLDVVIAVRNERQSILAVLNSLGDQTLKPQHVVVVDDGSDDGTGDLLHSSAASLGYRLIVITLPHHTRSYVGRPELAQVFNSGLERMRSLTPEPDYVMILGGDHVIPPDYAEKVVSRMESDRKLAIASGWIVGEPYWEQAPRGSSMVVRVDFWKKAGGLLFPVAYGWESWLRFKAEQLGYHTRSLKDVPTSVSRRTVASKGVLYGRAMYALGYYWLYVLGRCLLAARSSPRGAVQMLAGFVDHRGVTRLDVSGWVNSQQRRTLLERTSQIIRKKGRG